MKKQLHIVTYAPGMGDSFVAADLATTIAVLADIHGGLPNSITTLIDCNGCGTIGWIDDRNCDIQVDVVVGNFYARNGQSL